MTETPDVQRIYCEVYESRRLLKWRWRFRFFGGNSRKLGDDYINLADARKAVTLLTDPAVQVILTIVHRDGRTEYKGRIR